MDKLPNFAKARVLVVGDVMLDRHWLGQHPPLDTDEWIPNVKINDRYQSPGGAANVALNMSALGAKVTLLGITGDDDAADLLEKRLSQANVNYYLERCAHVNTITKIRVIGHHQQLLRLDFESSLDKVNKKDLLAKFYSLLNQIDIVILSDYAKGTLSNPQAFITAAKDAGLMTLVDPKGDDFTRYHGASLLTPNQKEFVNVMGPCPSNALLVTRAREMINNLGLEALLITRGEQGMTLICRDEPELHIRAKYREVYDVTGAGDTVIATLASALAAGEPIKRATQIANLAAGIAVGALGTTTVLPTELAHAQRQSTLAHSGRILTRHMLAVVVDKARKLKKRIVLAFGNFDIIHAGVIDYLQQAKALGDYLLVAVNADEQADSPETRSLINDIEHRMYVLAALEGIDWIVPFTGRFPYSVLESVTPDVLVVPDAHENVLEVVEYTNLSSDIEVKVVDYRV